MVKITDGGERVFCQLGILDPKPDHTPAKIIQKIGDMAAGTEFTKVRVKEIKLEYCYE